MANKFKIRQKIYGDAIINEGIASAAVNPGNLLELVAVDGKIGVKAHATAGDAGAHIVAIEDEMIGKTVNDAYAADANVKFMEARTADEFNMVVTGAVALLGKLASAGNGKLKTATAGQVALFQALEANSETGDKLVLVKAIAAETV